MSAMDFAFTAEQALRGPRQRRLTHAILASHRLGEQAVVIRNVSTNGIGATVRAIAPMVDELVTIQLPGQDTVSGKVRWVSGTSFGVELTDELELDLLLDRIRQHNEASSSQADWQVRPRHRVTAAPSQVNLRRL